MHPFDMNGTTYRTEAVSAKKLPRRTVMAILGCFLILIIGLIVAIGFAIAGYTRKLSDGKSTAPDKASVKPMKQLVPFQVLVPIIRSYGRM